MLKILLAPAETKLLGGDKKPFCKENIGFPAIYDKQLKVLEHYEDKLKNSNLDDLSTWFGLKKIVEVQRYCESLRNKPTMKAIKRYTGIAFDAINYIELNKEEQKYIEEHVLIFSNLFGVLKASDLIPDYKYKQGSKLPNIDVEKYYKEHLKDILDEYLCDSVIDLRANYYDKFYKAVVPTITYKFLKNGKVVSHWAKHYRGLVVRVLAKNKIENFAELMNMPIEGLSLVEIQEKKNIKTLIMEIKN